MKRSVRMACLAWVALSLVASGAARATILTWNFSVPAGSQASPHTYLDNTITYGIPTYGYAAVNGPISVVVSTDTWGPGVGYTNYTGIITSRNLYGKNLGLCETGLGLTGWPFNEMQYRTFVQMDMTNLYANGFTGVMMTIGSRAIGEGYYLWGSNTLGVPGLLLRTGLGPPCAETFALPDFGTYTYYSVSATPVVFPHLTSDVLILDGLTASLNPDPSIDVSETYVWTTGDGTNVGDVAIFTYVVTNTGNTTLNPVTVVDDQLGPITLLATSLAPGASTSGTAQLVVTQPMIDAGSQTNIATATGTPPTGPNVTDTDTQTIDFLDQPSIDVVKTFAWTTGDGSHVGNIVTFTYLVTNTGNVTLDPVTVADDQLGPITLLATSLAPGIPTTGTATLTLTQPLLDVGSQTNTATATGTPPEGPDVTDTDTQIVPLVQMPVIDLEKDVSFDGGVTWTHSTIPPGPTILVNTPVSFRYVITNSGNVSLTSVTLTDDVYNAGSTPPFIPAPPIPDPFAPGAVYTYMYGPIPAAAGQHANTGTATGTAPNETVIATSDPNYFVGGTSRDFSVFQAYPASSPQVCDTGYVTEAGEPSITAMPGILCISPGTLWSNYIPAAQAGVPYTIKNTTFTKTTQGFTQCSQAFPAHVVTQHGTPNIRLWWPLMYETPGTTFTLSILYGTPTLWDDDGPGPHKPAWVHLAQWSWTVEADFESLGDLIEVFGEMPFGLDEVPLISDEDLYDALQTKVANADAAYQAGDLALAAAILAEFELEVMDACIDESPPFPNPGGPGTGIANSDENPACCKLLVDIEYILQTLGIGQPSKPLPK